MLGSPAWKALGLGVTGIAHPKHLLAPACDADPSDDKPDLFDTGAPPLAPLPAAIKEMLMANEAIPPSSFCTHPM